jgi:phosphoenolpyruvate carboxykinase (GTP)
MGDYFAYWLAIGHQHDASKLPRIFAVNWFRKDSGGRWLWPGYSENSRVLEWIFRRLEGSAEAVDEPIGHLPAPGALNVARLKITPEAVAELLRVDRAAWAAELPLLREHFATFGDHLPAALMEQLDALEQRLLS